MIFLEGDYIYLYNRKKIKCMEKKQEQQLAFVNALKAVDYEKEYKQALRDLAETMFDMEFDENNEPIVSPNDTK